MVLPYVIVIVLFVIFLTISNIVMSFSDDGKFTFKNYLDIFKDQIFYKAIKNTAVWVFGSVLGQISLGLAVALLLNQISWTCRCPLAQSDQTRTGVLQNNYSNPSVGNFGYCRWRYVEMDV